MFIYLTHVRAGGPTHSPGPKSELPLWTILVMAIGGALLLGAVVGGVVLFVFLPRSGYQQIR